MKNIIIVLKNSKMIKICGYEHYEVFNDRLTILKEDGVSAVFNITNIVGFMTEEES